ncbi:hypothetical protein BT69DRAFT_821658 [Atractiella rhizophila]|nr:hypothetical protein BT69DRAFT_821658 [Atractiella rhizophila]
MVSLLRMERKMRRKMRRLTMRMAKAYDAIKSAVSSQKMKALVHFFTPDYTNLICLSILPSFLSRLPPSAHTLRISFVLSRSIDWTLRMRSTLSNLSLERVENAVDKDGAINLRVTVNSENVTATFLDVEGQLSADKRGIRALRDSHGDQYCYSRMFPRVRENAIFAPIASYSKGYFVPVSGDDSSSFPSLHKASIIQLSFPPPRITSCSISSLPVELLCLIFSFFDNVSTLSDVCKLWKAVAVPYWREPGAVMEKYKRLKRYPSAGRLWDSLWLTESMDVEMVKEVIAGSPNVTEVMMYAFWSEEEAKIVLNAIEGLKRVDDVTFARWGSRKWRKEEIENFVRRMGDRIRRLKVYDVEDSPVSASADLHLSSRLEYLILYECPPLSSLSLPHPVKHLALCNMCPLPSSISDYPLPPLLFYLQIVLAPFSTDGKASILPTPLDLSHLTHLSHLFLDGGEETSNLVSPALFSTLTNAKAIRAIILQYCVVDSFDFSDFVHWFFGDWRVRGGDWVDRQAVVVRLEVRLFFGEWSEEEIVIGRCTMKQYPWKGHSGVWESGEGGVV